MLNALTCLVAQDVADMGGADTPQTNEEGADTAVWLATLGDYGPSKGGANRFTVFLNRFHYAEANSSHHAS